MQGRALGFFAFVESGDAEGIGLVRLEVGGFGFDGFLFDAEREAGRFGKQRRFGLAFSVVSLRRNWYSPASPAAFGFSSPCRTAVVAVTPVAAFATGVSGAAASADPVESAQRPRAPANEAKVGLAIRNDLFYASTVHCGPHPCSSPDL